MEANSTGMYGSQQDGGNVWKPTARECMEANRMGGMYGSQQDGTQAFTDNQQSMVPDDVNLQNHKLS